MPRKNNTPKRKDSKRRSTYTSTLEDEAAYAEMSGASNPYGDGLASRRIADILER